MTSIKVLKNKGWNLTEYYNFLNYNFQDYLNEFGFLLNESSSYKDYSNLYESFFKYQYNRPYYFCDNHTYENYQKGIYESLKTHDIQKFTNALYDYCVSIRIIYPENYGTLSIIADDDSDKVLIEQLCQFYGYYITTSEYNAEKLYIYIIEATYGYKDVTDKVYNEFNGIVYHITTISHIHKIKQIGLIPKHLDKKVTHPGRIYFTTDSNIQSLYSLGQQLYKKRYRWCILKVDLNKMPNNTKLKFYVDPAYEKFGVFTCENIGPQCISIMNKE